MTAKFFDTLMASDSPTDIVFINPMSPTRTAVPLSMIGKRSSRISVSPDSEIPPPSLKSKRKVSITAEPLDADTLSPKRDARGYAILLVEMRTRTSPLDISLAYLIESIKWPGVEFVTLIKNCLEPDPERRPDTKEVLRKMIEFDAVVYAAKT